MELAKHCQKVKNDFIYIILMMFNKPKHIKEPARVGKNPEKIKFKKNLIKKINNSSYEMIRDIVESNDNTIELNINKDIKKSENKNLKSHKKYK